MRMAIRPHVIRATGTGKFITFFNLSNHSRRKLVGLDNAVGIAVADKPEGPYQWYGVLQYNGRQVDGCDLNVFTDDDGKQYLITGNNSGPRAEWLYELAPDCLSVVKNKDLRTGGESPAMFKHDGVYFLLHSNLTGFETNDNFYHTAANIWGPWQFKGNIAKGDHSQQTFLTQTTDVFPVAGKKGAFIWMGDSLRMDNKIRNPWLRTVILPITIKNKGEMEINWRDYWDLSFFGEKYGHARNQASHAP
jgi:hypothetical protein